MNETFDSRTVHHKLRRGEITQAQYNEYLSSLPDDSEEGVETETRFTASFASRASNETEADASDDS